MLYRAMRRSFLSCQLDFQLPLRTLAVVVTIGLSALMLPTATQANPIFFDVENLGGTQWRYDYTLGNDVAPDIGWFTVYFDLEQYTNIAIVASPTDWDPLAIQPDPGLAADGFVDWFSLGAGVLMDDILTGFSVTFDFLGAGTPGSQPFDINAPTPGDPFQPTAISQGVTESNAVVSEPGTLTLLALGCLALLHSRRRLLVSRNALGLLLVTALVLPAAQVWAASGDLTVTGTDVITSTRVSRTHFDYTLTIDVDNAAEALTNVTGLVSSTSTATEILEDTVVLGTIPANSQITSTDTFTIRHDRRVLFDPDVLVWTFSGLPANTAPIADAGPDQTVTEGQTVTLNGAGSSDGDGDPLTFSWSLTTPVGSAAVLSDPTAVMPTFVADISGTFEASLVVNDGIDPSVPDSVVITTEPGNTPPVAVAGPDQSATTGDTITLDGSGSSDADGDVLSFAWAMDSAPAGSTTTLSDPSAVMPTFFADLDGTYAISLRVNDGTVDSAPDIVTVTTTPGNTAPNAHAGPDQSVTTGALVQLDGSGSSDANGDPLAFAWSFVARPAGSTALLAADNTSMPSFTADVPGQFVVQLIVNDGTVDSASDTVVVTTTPGNTAPVADAGLDQTGSVGDTIQLDGTNSSDADGDPLTFAWSLTTVPAASAAVLSDPTLATPTFDADEAGIYIAQLVVDDGTVNSTPDTTMVTVEVGPNDPPEATDDTVTTDEDVDIQIDVLANDTDPDSDPLNIDGFSQPNNGTATQVGDQIEYQPDPDFNGTDTFTYTVSDGTDTDVGNVTVTVNAVNDPPVAEAGPDQSTLTTNTISLDGSASSDPEGDALTYLWATDSAPAGGTATYSDATAVSPSVTFDTAGVYVLSLVVNDGTDASPPDFVSITVQAVPEISIANTSVTEGDTGTASLDFTVSLSTAPGQTVTVDFATADGSATTADGDYLARNGTLTFDPAGPLSQTVAVVVNGDTDTEPDETLDVNLTNPANATLGVAQATGTIVNDDTQPTLTLTNLSLQTGESGDMTVTLSQAAGPGGVTVNLSASGAALTVPANVQVAQGSSAATFSVTAGNAAGTATVTASASGFSDGTGTVTISDRALSIVVNTLLGVGRTNAGTVVLADPAPAGGVNVALQSGDANVFTVSPPNVTVTAGATQAPFSISGVGAGSTALSASAAGFVTDTVNVQVTTALISLPTVTAVAPGQTASLPLSLSEPAPAGGLTVALTSSNSAIATVDASVFIPAGQQIPAANPQVSGVALGTASVLASAPGFASASGTVDVEIGLSFQPTSLTVPESDTGDLTLQLSAPAPTGGLDVNLLSADPAVATVPTAVNIPQGQTTAVVTVTAVSVGTTTVTASGTSLTPASATVDITPAPAITFANQIIGDDLQTQTNGVLGAPAPAGGVAVTVTSSNPTRLLVSDSTTTAGTASAVFNVTAGQAFFGTVVLQALDDSGTADVSISAPGYATQTATVTLQPSGFIINSPSVINTTTFAADTNVQLVSARLNPATLAWAASQAVRGGLTVNVVMSSSDANVGTIASPVAFNGGSVSANSAFDPENAGTTVLSVAAPAGFQTPTNFQSIDANVTGSSFNVSSAAVGEDLQLARTVSLQAAPPSPVTVTLTSNDPSRVLLSTTATGAGSASVTYANVSSTFVGQVFIQGISQGATTVTYAAPGYSSVDQSVSVDPSGFIINSPSAINTTTLSPDTNVQIVSARLNPTTLAWSTSQALRAGLNVTVNLTSSDTNVGTVSAAVLNGGSTSANASFDPLNSGTTTLSVNPPAGFDTPTNFQSIVATVTGSTFNVNDVQVGDDLQVARSVILQAAPPAPVTVTLTSSDPATVRLSTSATAAGTGSVSLPNVSSTFAGSVFIQGLSQGTATITYAAPGYTDATQTVTVDPSGFIINSPSVVNTTTFAADTNVQITPARLNPATLNWATNEQVRGGFSVDVDLTSSDTTVGTILSPVAMAGGATSAFAPFDPLTAGTTVISVQTPAGFEAPANFNQINANVTAPDILLPATLAVGLDLQSTVFVRLESAPPSPVDVTLTVASGAVATLSTDPTLAGSTTLTFTGVTGTTVGTVYVQGRSLGGTTLTAQAAGYADQVSAITVDPSGFIINSPSSITTTVGSTRNVQVVSARLNPSTLNWAQTQALRGGLSAAVSLSIGDTGVGTLSPNPLSFSAGDTSMNTIFTPVAPGATTVEVLAPTGFSSPSNFRIINATVNP